MKLPDFSDANFQIVFHRRGWKFWIANWVIVNLVFFFARPVWDEVSILYVVWLSLYANFTTDFGGQSAAEASKQTESEGEG